MKNLKLLIAFLLLLSTTTLSAQSGKEKTGSLLWKISGKDLSKPSYVLGTLHVEYGSYLDSIPGARAALESSEQVIGEILMSNKPQMMTILQQRGMMLSDTTYKMLYSEEDYQLIDAQLKLAIGAGLDQLATMKPSFINMIIAVMLYTKSIPNFNPTNVIDDYVQQEAIKMGKSVLELETVEFQTDMLFSSSLKRQAEILLCNLKNPEYAKEGVHDLIEAYHKGDLVKLYSYVNDPKNPCTATQKEIDLMLKDRNDEWMKKLPSMMMGKSSFIAVGAMHLAGEEGVLHQLEQLGYQVEAVNFQ